MHVTADSSLLEVTAGQNWLVAVPVSSPSSSNTLIPVCNEKDILVFKTQSHVSFPSFFHSFFLSASTAYWALRESKRKQDNCSTTARAEPFHFHFSIV